MGLMPATVPGAMLRMNWFQGDCWIDIILEHALTASSSFAGAELTEMAVLPHWMPIFATSQGLKTELTLKRDKDI